jgi:hypothetical protein
MEFDLDLGRLERQYKLLQWSLHPDKASSQQIGLCLLAPMIHL